MTRHEKRPPAHPLALLGQLLQLKQLSNRTPPPGQQDLVKTPRRPRPRVRLPPGLRHATRCRPRLEGRLVTRHRGEGVPDPLQRVLALLDAAGRHGGLGGEGFDFLFGQGGVGAQEAGTGDQDVAVLRGGVVLRLEDRQEPLVADGVGVERFEGFQFFELRGWEVRGRR